MEERDKKLIAQLVREDETLKQCVEQHQEYERQLEEFNSRIHLSTEESLERKTLQKLKLAISKPIINYCYSPIKVQRIEHIEHIFIPEYK